jgi:DNA-binding NtrC family response regulator
MAHNVNSAIRSKPATNSTSSAVAAVDVQVPRNILVADDEETACENLKELLQTVPGYQIDTCNDGEKALELLLERSYSIVITDLRMPNLDGMDLIREVMERRLPVTVIVTTGDTSIDEVVQAVRLGAFDFLTKPIDVKHLLLVVEKAMRERALKDEVLYLREQLQHRHSFHNILSKNPEMHKVFELVSNLAHTTSTVLIEGETGTGKEVVARAIHQASEKRSGPLVAVNCAALPESLLESELFGHEKGAFTSAVGQRRGRFELADGGTIFLDEIGDVPAAMQAKLLRVLQDRRFERVGGTTSITVDVRVIAATNRSLQRLVSQGKFREDLFYRLNVVKIDLPPLRDRPEDILLLAVHFIDKFTRDGETPKQLSPQASEILLNYRWPGNVRELENAIERALVTAQDNVIRPENLPPHLLAPTQDRFPFKVTLDRPLTQLLSDTVISIERQYIRKALKKTRGNVGRCAKICGLSRRSVTTKIAEYGIKKDLFKEE